MPSMACKVEYTEHPHRFWAESAAEIAVKTYFCGNFGVYWLKRRFRSGCAPHGHGAQAPRDGFTACQ